MSEIKPRRLTWEEIRIQAERVRAIFYNPPCPIPVPVEDIIEFKLKMEIRPEWGLRERADVEAILLGDLNTIIVDNALYYNKNYSKRIRFTFAHELGHYYLHSQEIRAYKFNSIDEWLEFKQGIDENDLDWFERQANEFAGRFLVPVDALKERIMLKEGQVKAIYERLPGEEIDDELILSISRMLSDTFMVSAEVIKKRIRSEFDWVDLKSDLLY